MLDRRNYLKSTLPNYVTVTSRNKYWLQYQTQSLKRFIIHFIIFFTCQFIAIGCVSFQGIVPPMYPPMGVAFVILYLYGRTAIFALIFADVIAYSLQHFSFLPLTLYLLADIVPAFIVTLIWKSIFKTDDFESNQPQEWLQFILITMLFTCFLSAGIRLLAFYDLVHNLSFSNILSQFIQLWFADINAVIVLYSFLISWLYIMYSRSLIRRARQIIKKMSFWLFLLCLGSALTTFHSLAFCYWIFASMQLSLYLTYRAGMTFGTAFMYAISFIYFAYFTLHKADFIFHYGLKLYTLISIVLFTYNISVLCLAIAGRKLRGKNGKTG